MKPRTTRALYAIHKWTGLIVGVNVLIFSVTGAWIIYGWDVERFLRGKTGPDPYEAAIASFPLTKSETHAPLGVSLEKISALEGKPAQFGRFYVYEDKTQPEILMASFAGEGEGGTNKTQWYYVDPGSGNVLRQPTLEETSKSDAFSQWIYNLHANLLMGAAGYYVTGALAAIMFISNLTGLIIYWPFVKGAVFGAIRRRTKVNRTAADMHKLIGITALAFNLMISWTGFVLCLGAPITRELMHYNVLSKLGVDTKAEPPAPEKWAPIDAVYAAATAALPQGMEIDNLLAPGNFYSKRHFFVEAREIAPPRNLRPYAVLIDAETGKALDINTLPLISRIMRITYPMHFGDFGGWPVRVAFTLFAITSGFLSVTGYVMFISKWWRRRGLKEHAPELASASAAGALNPKQHAAYEES